jgi:hypothetical protein
LISYGGELLDASQEQHATHVIHSGNESYVVSSHNASLHVIVFENDTGHATSNIQQVFFRTVQRTHTNKDPLIYAATSPHTDIF